MLMFLPQKRHVYITFKIPISDYDYFDKLIDFIPQESGKKAFFESYRMVYPRLISSLKWKFNFFFQGRQKVENETLEKLCNKIVDVVYETFTRKYYFVKNSQSKRGHIYLIVRKKTGRTIGEEKTSFIKKSLMFLQVLLNGSVTDMIFWTKNISLTKVN